MTLFMDVHSLGDAVSLDDVAKAHGAGQDLLPQPRQRRQRHGKPEPVCRSPPTARIKERDIRTRQREIPDQVIPADIGERPQPLQLILRKQPRRHRPTPTT